MRIHSKILAISLLALTASTAFSEYTCTDSNNLCIEIKSFLIRPDPGNQKQEKINLKTRAHSSLKSNTVNIFLKNFFWC
jgi:hypothetical protein